MSHKKQGRLFRAGALAGKAMKTIPRDLQATPLPLRIAWTPRELFLAVAVTMTMSSLLAYLDRGPSTPRPAVIIEAEREAEEAPVSVGRSLLRVGRAAVAGIELVEAEAARRSEQPATCDVGGSRIAP